jgi:hypothetical protein
MLNDLAAAQPERRMVKRWVVDCQARLSMPGGERDGRLSDLSAAGARFEGPNAPAQGTSGFLAWGGEEHFCRVIWSNGASCGLTFERPISLDVIRNTAEMVEEETGPIANLDRIPIARKRSQRLALVRDD